MQRRVKTYGKRPTRVVYIDDAFPPFQSGSLTAAIPSTSHSHKLQPTKPSTSIVTGLRKSSKTPIVLSDTDSESDLSKNRQPLTQLSTNLRRPRGHGRAPDTAKPSNKEPSRRPARFVQISSSSEGSDVEESTQRKAIRRTSTAPSRLGPHSTATSTLRGSKPARASLARRTAPTLCDLSSDEEGQTTSATQAPNTSDSETEESISGAPARPSKRGVSSRSPMYTRRITTTTVVLSSSSEEDLQGVTSSVDHASPIVTGGYRLLLPHIRT